LWGGVGDDYEMRDAGGGGGEVGLGVSVSVWLSAF
jgi:hypothetical protein